MAWLTYPFVFPSFCGQITTPLVYTEDMSIAQQIAHLFGIFKEQQNNMENYVSKDEFSDFLEWLKGENEALLEIAEQYTDDEIARLQKQIDDLSYGVRQWNVQHGKYTSTVQAQRDMFNDLTIKALTIGELNSIDDLTVESLANSGLTVRGLAVYSGAFFKGDDYINNGLIDVVI